MLVPVNLIVNEICFYWFCPQSAFLRTSWPFNETVLIELKVSLCLDCTFYKTVNLYGTVCHSCLPNFTAEQLAKFHAFSGSKPSPYAVYPNEGVSISALFWDITQRTVVILYRHFGKKYQSHLKRVKKSKKIWRLKMGPIGFPETLLQNYPSKQRNIPEERTDRLRRGGGLKSRKGFSNLYPGSCRKDIVVCTLETFHNLFCPYFLH
jgi:hypothetical protein